MDGKNGMENFNIPELHILSLLGKPDMQQKINVVSVSDKWE